MPILYTYYGDDFTGSTDVLEQFGANGIPAVLFLGVPTTSQVATFPEVQVIGIAGDSRSRSPEWMSANLPEIFRTLQKFQAPITHYKTCSTFDSSPSIGSIGRAIEIGREVFSPDFVPIVVGAPHLRRYVAFGHLFAGAPDGTVRRIDRHPMSRHPITPMRESDLRRHLAGQTDMKIGLIDTPTLKSDAAGDGLDSFPAKDYDAILFDTIDDDTQSKVGELLWRSAQQQSLFAVGSSGLTASLVSAWRKAGLLQRQRNSAPLSLCRPLLVVSGSCSAVTECQLRYALSHGYHGISIDPAALLDPINSTHDCILESAAASLSAGQDTILYTALGTPTSSSRGDELGVALGDLLSELLARSAASEFPVRRVLICGGDTASHAMQQLGIHALTWLANIQPGGPLCRAHADSPLDKLELVLKGGQVGTTDFFDLVRGF